jgi:NAD(P)-dependent dehydrogenase (short-subunit alcohol dehydrogenase family)
LKDVVDKVAFITGGASGIGLSMAQVFLRRGMKVAIGDIRDDHLAQAAARFAGEPRIHCIKLDVTSRAGMNAAADETEAKFGNIHVLCNNAGVGLLGGAKSVTYDDWDWSLAVNLGGVINGVQTFLPRMLAHGEPGHIVNTSTIGAVLPGPGGVAYLAAKSAVLTLSECLKNDLAGDNIGITVLIPGPTTTRIHEVGKLRPKQFQNTGVRELEERLGQAPLFGNGMDPMRVGEMVLEAIERDQLFVFTHNDFKVGVEQRFAAMLTGFSDEPVDPERAAGFGFPVINEIYTEIVRRAARDKI